MKSPTPYKFQERGIRKINRFDGRALLADEMGLGKTAQALWYAKRYLKRGPIVVVCPASIKWNWEREVKHFVQMRTRILEGTRPEELRPRQDTVYILNYDILGPWLPHLIALDPRLIIGDEIHYCKSRQAKRTKYMRQLVEACPRFVAISGTPMTNRPAELWSILNMIDPKRWSSFWAFANRYCKPEHTPWGIKYNGADNLDELHDILKAELMIRRKKSQVLKELPPKTQVLLPVELSNRKEYKEAETDLVTWLLKTAPNRANKARKNERKIRFQYLKGLVGRGKMKSIKEWIDNYLEESPSKLIMFGVHRAVMQAYHEMYDRSSVLVNGSVKGRDRQRAFDQFVKNKRCRVFFGNIQAAGVGWNGTVANTVGFAEFGWTPGEHTQAIDRAHRIGQKDNVTAYFLFAQNTVDEHLIKMIAKKQRVLDQALDGGKVEEGLDDTLDLLEDILIKTRRK